MYTCYTDNLEAIGNVILEDLTSILNDLNRVANTIGIGEDLEYIKDTLFSNIKTIISNIEFNLNSGLSFIKVIIKSGNEKVILEVAEVEMTSTNDFTYVRKKDKCNITDNCLFLNYINKSKAEV